MSSANKNRSKSKIVAFFGGSNLLELFGVYFFFAFWSMASEVTLSSSFVASRLCEHWIYGHNSISDPWTKLSFKNMSYVCPKLMCIWRPRKASLPHQKQMSEYLLYTTYIQPGFHVSSWRHYDEIPTGLYASFAAFFSYWEIRYVCSLKVEKLFSVHVRLS